MFSIHHSVTCHYSEEIHSIQSFINTQQSHPYKGTGHCYLTPDPPNLFWCASNFRKIWSVCGQHEVPYV